MTEKSYELVYQKNYLDLFPKQALCSGAAELNYMQYTSRYASQISYFDRSHVQEKDHNLTKADSGYCHSS